MKFGQQEYEQPLILQPLQLVYRQALKKKKKLMGILLENNVKNSSYFIFYVIDGFKKTVGSIFTILMNLVIIHTSSPMPHQYFNILSTEVIFKFNITFKSNVIKIYLAGGRGS